MSNFLDGCNPTTLEHPAEFEVCQHFGDELKQFSITRNGVERLERNMAMLAMAANLGASRSTSKENIIVADDGMEWHKSVFLMNNIHLCHRHIHKGEEFAVVEYFATRGTNEIWNRGWNANEVLQLFVREQQQAIQVWMEDMAAQVKQFLAEKYPGQDLSRVADGLIQRHVAAIPQ